MHQVQKLFAITYQQWHPDRVPTVGGFFLSTVALRNLSVFTVPRRHRCVDLSTRLSFARRYCEASLLTRVCGSHLSADILVVAMNHIFEPDNASPPARPVVRNRRRAILISVLFHAVLLFALLWWYIPRRSNTAASSSKQSALSGSSGQAPVKEPRLLAATSGEHVPSEQIKASLESAMEQTDGLSNERKLSELEKNLNRLNSISSPESIQATTDKIAETLGLASGPSPSPSPAQGPFDTGTAQIHDVTRTRQENGSWSYHSMLVDKDGRTQSVELTEAEGEVTYSTFQQLKKFPMAEGIYRQLVMPMLQSVLDAADAAEEQARRLRQEQAAEQDQNAQHESAASEAEEPTEAP